MGKVTARKRRKGTEPCWQPGDTPDQLKELTKAELVQLVCKLAANQPATCEDKGSSSAPTLVVNGSVRSGQTVSFPEGDLVILGSVSSGAEVEAGGSIHIYGALRGRAYSGTNGRTTGRIFCLRLEPELVGIAGVCRIADDLDADLVGFAAHAWRDSNGVAVARFTERPEKLPMPARDPEPKQPATPLAAPLTVPWLSWARGWTRAFSRNSQLSRA